MLAETIGSTSSVELGLLVGLLGAGAGLVWNASKIAHRVAVLEDSLDSMEKIVRKLENFRQRTIGADSRRPPTGPHSLASTTSIQSNEDP